MRLLRSWTLRGLGWFTLTEAVARALLEGAFVAALWIAGLRLETVVLAWVAFHTAAWLLFYGGFLGVYNLLGLAASVPRLEKYREDVCDAIRGKSFFRLAFLSGSGARGELNPRSDIDVFVAPTRSVSAKFRGIVFLWGLRASATLHLLPLEATWADTDRYLPYFLKEETVTMLTGPSHREERGGARRVMVAFSGPDKGWTRGVAEYLAAGWRSRNVPSVLVHADEGPGRRIRMEKGFDYLWRGIGRSMEDLKWHPGMKTVHDLGAWVDYVGLAWRISVASRPRSIVMVDGYLVDVLARLRSHGPVSVTVEGMFVGLSFEPDASIMVDPGGTGTDDLRADVKAATRTTYQELGNMFRLSRVSAGGSMSSVCEKAEGLLAEELGIVSGSPREGRRAGVPEQLS